MSWIMRLDRKLWKFLVDSQDTSNARLLSHSGTILICMLGKKYSPLIKLLDLLWKKKLSQKLSKQAIEIWIEILNHQKYQAWKHGFFRKKISTTIFYFLDVLIFVIFSFILLTSDVKVLFCFCYGLHTTSLQTHENNWKNWSDTF